MAEELSHAAAAASAEQPGEAQDIGIRLSAHMQICGQLWVAAEAASGNGSSGSSSGSGKQEPERIVALHGWLDNSASFVKLAPMLAARGYTVLALDFPGHGLSSHKHDVGGYSAVFYAQTALSALAEFGWTDRPFHLIGHSMGGSVSGIISALSPSLIKSLTLIDNTVVVPAGRDQTQILNIMREHAKHERALQSKRPRVYASLHAAVLERRRRARTFPVGVFAYRGKPDIEESSAEAIVRRGTIKNDNGQVMYRHDLHCQNPIWGGLPPWLQAHADACLAAIEAPVLVFQATNGLPYPPVAQKQQSKVRTLKLIEVEGSHHVHLDAPERLMPHLLAHLASCAALPLPKTKEEENNASANVVTRSFGSMQLPAAAPATATATATAPATPKAKL